MKIVHATIRDFGPYYGQQEIDLSPAERRVILVHGENMRGKTSLLRALRWALYGNARTRGGTAIPLVRLLNTDASEEHRYVFSVDLKLQDGQDLYEVTRQAQAAAAPSRDADFDMTLHVRKNGVVLSADDGATAITRLLPEAVSHFFLFDGEMLDEFEDLLSNATSQAATIRRSIEEILGVPALENSIEDLQHQLSDANKRRDNAAKNVNAAKKDAERAADLDANIAIVKEDVSALEAQLGATRSDIEKVDARLKASEQIRAEADQLTSLREAFEQNKARREQIRAEKRQALSSAWQDVLAQAVQGRLRSLETLRDEMTRANQAAVQVATQRAALEAALVENCPTCKQAVPEDLRRDIERALEELAEGKGPDPSEIEATAGAIARLRRVRNAGSTPTILALEVEAKRLIVEATKTGNRVTEIETKLRDHDLSEIAVAQKERERLVREEGKLEHSIKEVREKLGVLESDAALVRHRISQVSDPQLDRLNREVELYQSLLAVFRDSLAALRDELKHVIERDASEIFKVLTTDKGYSGLKINDSYGLYILDAQGAEVLIRSAGAEQVVALSLIGALNHNAVKQGPVIMDTPFGRLDRNHRSNVLAFLPTMAEQVVLLVHGGEVDRNRDLAAIAPTVQRQYELAFVTSSRTEILPLGEGAA